MTGSSNAWPAEVKKVVRTRRTSMRWMMLKLHLPVRKRSEEKWYRQMQSRLKFSAAWGLRNAFPAGNAVGRRRCDVGDGRPCRARRRDVAIYLPSSRCADVFAGTYDSSPTEQTLSSYTDSAAAPPSWNVETTSSTVILRVAPSQIAASMGGAYTTGAVQCPFPHICKQLKGPEFQQLIFAGHHNHALHCHSHASCW